MRGEQSVEPPRHVIDLSLSPRDRYRALASRYKTKLNALTGLFDQLLLDLALPRSWLPMIHACSKLLLRRVSESEQTEELRGVSEETGISMYLLVAFNVVLDLLMGCTSGAVRSSEPRQDVSQAKMLHFRTLDWAMDPLRKIVVQLDFVQSTSESPAEVIASSVTYVGFLGVLTGVKRGLSISLNFRPVHNANTKLAHWRFYAHHLLVLLGYRPSVASLLRSSLLAHKSASPDHQPSIDTVAAQLRRVHTTAAYIVISDGNATLAVEKDYSTAKIRRSSSFIAITNHDIINVAEKKEPESCENAMSGRTAGLQELLEESGDRLDCIESKWRARIQRSNRIVRKNHSKTRHAETRDHVSVPQREIIKWLCDWPTTNEATHFAAILDPRAGEVSWCRSYPEPLHEPQ